jgi:hypothetical protein
MFDKIPTPAEAAFYLWFHASGKFGTQLENLREAYVAGYLAASQPADQDAEV